MLALGHSVGNCDQWYGVDPVKVRFMWPNESPSILDRLSYSAFGSLGVFQEPLHSSLVEQATPERNSREHTSRRNNGPGL